MKITTNLFRVLSALSCGHLYLVNHVAFVANEKLEDSLLLGCLCVVKVLHPLLRLLETEGVGHIVHDECGLGAFKVHFGKGVKLFLSSGIPQIQLHSSLVATFVCKVNLLGLEAST